MIRPKTIIHQDLWLGELVPSPHKRSKLSNWIYCTLRRRDKGICQGVPISYSLGKKLDLYISVPAIGIWNAKEWGFLVRLIGGARSFVGIDEMSGKKKKQIGALYRKNDYSSYPPPKAKGYRFVHVCPSVLTSIRPSVRPSVFPSVRPEPLLSNHWTEFHET